MNDFLNYLEKVKIEKPKRSVIKKVQKKTLIIENCNVKDKKLVKSVKKYTINEHADDILEGVSEFNKNKLNKGNNKNFKKSTDLVLHADDLL